MNENLITQDLYDMIEYLKQQQSKHPTQSNNITKASTA